ncbi:MAG: mechanosensitive ion channel family protein [Gemmatimonadaceae bacterium]
MDMNDLRSYQLYGNPAEVWLIFLGITLGTLALLWVLKQLLIRRLQPVATRTRTNLDDLLLDLVQRTGWFFHLFIALSIASQALAITPRWEARIGRLAILALLVQMALWGVDFIAYGVKRWISKRGATEPGSIALIKAGAFLAQVMLWTIVFLLALDNFGFDIMALVAGFGIGGIAIALAVQNVLGDMLASLAIVLDKPFVVGDFIIVDDFIGTVEHIGLKSTRLRSLGGEQLVMSNADLLKSRIRNYKRMVERRIVFSVGVVYGTSHAKLQRIPDIIREIVGSQERTRFDRCHLKGFADSSIDFETVHVILSSDYAVYMDIQQAINLEIIRRFEEEEIGFAFPTRTVIVEGSVMMPRAATLGAGDTTAAEEEAATAGRR